MKKFNQVISIEVPVDSIAQLLLDNLNPEFKHRELVAEAIVGRMMNDKSLTFLYNSLNGYTCDIDFCVGDVVCTTPGNLRVYGYFTPESIEKNDTIYGDILEGVVIEINPYANEKIKIEYKVPNKKGEFDTKTQWVNHLNWNGVLKTT